MLKAVSCLIGFYEKVRVLVKKATDENPGDRPTVEEFLQQISSIRPWYFASSFSHAVCSEQSIHDIKVMRKRPNHFHRKPPQKL